MTSKQALLDLADEIKYTHSDGKVLTEYDNKRVKIISEDLCRLRNAKFVLECEIEDLDKARENLANDICDMEDDLRFDYLTKMRSKLIEILNILKGVEND
jgi:hypothetical protein